MMFIEREDAPPPLLTDGDQLKLKNDPLASDDRWVKSIIDGLAGVLRDVKH